MSSESVNASSFDYTKCNPRESVSDLIKIRKFLEKCQTHDKITCLYKLNLDFGIIGRLMNIESISEICNDFDKEKDDEIRIYKCYLLVCSSLGCDYPDDKFNLALSVLRNYDVPNFLRRDVEKLRGYFIHNSSNLDEKNVTIKREQINEGIMDIDVTSDLLFDISKSQMFMNKVQRVLDILDTDDVSSREDLQNILSSLTENFRCFTHLFRYIEEKYGNNVILTKFVLLVINSVKDDLLDQERDKIQSNNLLADFLAKIDQHSFIFTFNKDEPGDLIPNFLSLLKTASHFKSDYNIIGLYIKDISVQLRSYFEIIKDSIESRSFLSESINKIKLGFYMFLSSKYKRYSLVLLQYLKKLINFKSFFDVALDCIKNDKIEISESIRFFYDMELLDDILNKTYCKDDSVIMQIYTYQLNRDYIRECSKDETVFERECFMKMINSLFSIAYDESVSIYPIDAV